MGQPVEARKSYEAALRDDPQSVDAVLGLARLDQLADNPKDAEAGFQKALRLKPGDAKAWPRWVSSMSLRNGGPRHSNRSTRPLRPPRRTFYKHELAVAKTASGDMNAGLALFSQLVGPDKAHYNVAYMLGGKARRKTRFRSARWHFEDQSELRAGQRSC